MIDPQDPARIACAKFSANLGEPPCFEIWADAAANGQLPPTWEPCDYCLVMAEIERDEPLDPAAVVRPLL